MVHDLEDGGHPTDWPGALVLSWESHFPGNATRVI
jgi:hypothetical protein